MATQPRTRGTTDKTATALAWTSASLLHTGLWLSARGLAELFTLLEAAITATVILTALYCPEHISDRAFRMLPWTTTARPRHRKAANR